MDDGAGNTAEGLEMLRESRRQGVELVCATPHFYADEEDPRSFLQRRSEAWDVLHRAMDPGEKWPAIRLGAEVLYFPGMSGAEELRSLCLEGTPILLIEPPMAPWTETMLEEIEECGWFTYDDAMSTLNYDNDKRILAQAREYFLEHVGA